MPNKIIDINLICTLVEDFRNGATKKRLGEKYNLSPPTVRKLIKENYNQTYSRISENTVKSILELSNTSNTKTEIARELKIDCNTVRRVLRDNKKDFLQGEIKEYDKMSILDDYFRNLYSIEKLVEKYTYSSKRIKEFLNNNGREFRHNLNYNENDEKWLTYSKLVRRLTGTTMRFYGLVSPEGYHWDHKISISDGWKQKIPAEFISSRNNLELITIKDNLRKSFKSSINKEQLYNLVLTVNT